MDHSTPLARRRDCALRLPPLPHSGRRDPDFEWDHRQGPTGTAETDFYRPRAYGAFGPPHEATALDLVRRALQLAKTDEEHKAIIACASALAEIEKGESGTW